MTQAELDRRLAGIPSAGLAAGAPRCSCRHAFYSHANDLPGARECDWCGCEGFKRSAGQVRLFGTWVK